MRVSTGWLVALVFLAAGVLLPGCDLFGSDGDSDPGVEGVPPERLVAMSAAYSERNDDGSPVQRIVVADIEDPAARYDVLEEAGTHAERPCFSPDKRRLIYEDHEVETSGRGGRIGLLDLESGEARRLNIVDGSATIPLAGSLKGCVWKANGSGFYVSVSSAAGIIVFPFDYDIESGTTEQFALQQDASAALVYGRKGRDSILVLSNHKRSPDDTQVLRYYFVDAETGAYLEQIDNERLAGTRAPAYNDEQGQVVMRYNDPDIDDLAVASLDGSFFAFLNTSGTVPRWGPDGTVLVGRKIVEVEAGAMRELVEPRDIGGAIDLRTPDY